MEGHKHQLVLVLSLLLVVEENHAQKTYPNNEPATRKLVVVSSSYIFYHHIYIYHTPYRQPLKFLLMSFRFKIIIQEPHLCLFESIAFEIHFAVISGTMY